MRRILIALLLSPFALLSACRTSSPAAPGAASDATPARSEASTEDATGTAPPAAEAVAEDPTAIAEAERAQGTREAAAASATIAAAAPPRTLGPWRAPDGSREARVDQWACPDEDDLRATAASAGADGALVQGFERLVVRSADGSDVVVSSQLQNCGGLGGFGLEGRFWSSNGERFYFTDAREGLPDGLDCGCCPELSAWDAASGAVEDGFVVSPDGGQVARLAREGPRSTGLQVSDTDQSDSRMIALPPRSPEAQHLYAPEWSPDGSGLVIMEGCGSQPSGAYALRLSDGHWQYQAAPEPGEPIIEVDWAEDSKAIRMGTFNGAWIWNLGTGTVSPEAVGAAAPAATTPAPAPLGAQPAAEAAAKVNGSRKAIESATKDFAPFTMLGAYGGFVGAAEGSGGLLLTGLGNRVATLVLDEFNKPRLLGESELLGGNVTALSVEGNRVAAALGQGGLAILDVSEPARPLLLGSLFVGGEVRCLAMKGNRVLLVDDDFGLYLISLDDVRRPSFIGPGLPLLRGTEALVVAGNRVYLGGASGITVVDITKPEEPEVVTELKAAHSVRSLVLSGNTDRRDARPDQVLGGGSPHSPETTALQCSHPAPRLAAQRPIIRPRADATGATGSPTSRYGDRDRL